MPHFARIPFRIFNIGKHFLKALHSWAFCTKSMFRCLQSCIYYYYHYYIIIIELFIHFESINGSNIGAHRHRYRKNLLEEKKNTSEWIKIDIGVCSCIFVCPPNLSTYLSIYYIFIWLLLKLLFWKMHLSSIEYLPKAQFSSSLSFNCWLQWMSTNNEIRRERERGKGNGRYFLQ